MTQRHMLLNTFHWRTIPSSLPTQTCFRTKTDGFKVSEKA